jgi:flagellar hook-associated protein 2
MSDINIPGTSSSRFNTPSIVEDLMEAERIPLAGMESQLETFRTEKDLWSGVGRQLGSLNTASRALYGFENPFQEKIGTSSDESVLSATVTREASDESIELTVVQVAEADRFLSASLPRDYTAPEGDYVFTLGDKDVTVRFRGGRVSALVDTINRRSGGLVKASLVRDTSTTQVLVLEGGKTGSSNPLGFDGAALDLALDAGILETVANRAREFTPGTMQARAWEASFDDSRTENVGGNLRVSPQTEFSLPFSPVIESGRNLFLEVDVSLTKLAEEDYVAPPAPEGPAIPDTGQIEFEGIRIQSADSFVELPGYAPRPRRKR